MRHIALECCDGLFEQQLVRQLASRQSNGVVFNNDTRIGGTQIAAPSRHCIELAQCLLDRQSGWMRIPKLLENSIVREEAVCQNPTAPRRRPKADVFAQSHVLSHSPVRVVQCALLFDTQASSSHTFDD